VPVEATTRGLVVKMLGEAASFSEAAAELNRLRVPTPSGRGRWDSTTVWRVSGRPRRFRYEQPRHCRDCGHEGPLDGFVRDDRYYFEHSNPCLARARRRWRTKRR
jgi:hypothetical protein